MIKISEKSINESGFYKVLLESGNIHFVKYVKPGCFMSGLNRDYRNGDPYPITKCIEYEYLYGLNDQWEPDIKVKYENWPKGI